MIKLPTNPDFLIPFIIPVLFLLGFLLLLLKVFVLPLFKADQNKIDTPVNIKILPDATFEMNMVASKYRELPIEERNSLSGRKLREEWYRLRSISIKKK